MEVKIISIINDIEKNIIYVKKSDGSLNQIIKDELLYNEKKLLEKYISLITKVDKIENDTE
jgi:hypothetical protein